MRYLLALIALAALTANGQQSTLSGGPASGINKLNGYGTNASLFGVTNYYAPDLPGNTNGPLTIFRDSSAPPYLLVEDVNLGDGTKAKFDFRISTSGGIADFARFFMNTEHDGTPGSTANSEFQITVANSIGIGVGSGRGGNGHIQIFSGLTAGYGGANQWAYFQNQGPALAQNAATGFSGGLVFKSSELQGANQVDFYPGVVAYCILTNAPGRVALMFTGELGGNGGNTWDPNLAKARRWMQFQHGDLTNALFYKPINFVTNLGTAAIDCSLPMCDISQAGGTLTFTAPVNFDSQQLQYETPVMFITNSAVGALTLAAPANARLTGTTSVTRQCDIHWYIKIGKYTNGVITQWF